MESFGEGSGGEPFFQKGFPLQIVSIKTDLLRTILIKSVYNSLL